MGDPGTIQDIMTDTINGYCEYTEIRGSVEIVFCKDRAALWQGLSGEIKTPIGGCRGVGQENYGCDIWRILGQNLIPPVIDQANYYIIDLGKKYNEINKITATDIVTMKDGRLKITLYVDSIFGPMDGEVIVE